MPASFTAPADASPTAAVPPASSPGRHLLTLIVDALQLPEPAGTPEDEKAYLALVNRRSLLVLTACRRALAGQGDGGLLYAARDLYDAVSSLPDRLPARADSLHDVGMMSESPGTPAADLRGTVQQAIADLADVAQWLPGVTADEADRAAAILDRLSEETAEAAAMVRALPGRPSSQAGHTFATAAALATATQCEPDFARWLATVLRAVARTPGTALTASQPDSWDAWLPRQLVSGPPLAGSPPGPQPAGTAHGRAALSEPAGGPSATQEPVTSARPS